MSACGGWVRISRAHGQAQAQSRLPLSGSCSCGPSTTAANESKGLQTTLLHKQRNIAVCTQEKMTTCFVRVLFGTQNLTKKKTNTKTWLRWSQRWHRRDLCMTPHWRLGTNKETVACGSRWRGGMYEVFWHVRVEGRQMPKKQVVDAWHQGTRQRRYSKS